MIGKKRIERKEKLTDESFKIRFVKNGENVPQKEETTVTKNME